MTSKAALTAAFKKFDTDNSGALSRDEFLAVLTSQAGGNAFVR